MTDDTKLTIEFSSKTVRDHFATWLCELGEQDYWQWMEYREQELNGKITAISFDYHDERGKFLGDGIVRTSAGRLDEDR